MANKSLDEKAIFNEARQIQLPDARAEYLKQTCGEDGSLLERVCTLLKAYEEQASFLEFSPAGGFHGVLQPDHLDKDLASGQTTDVTRDRTPCDEECGDDLAFLTPTNKPGSLGGLGHYEIQEVVGCGGMGIVLRAFDERLHRVVAIKVMAAQLATSAIARKRFTPRGPGGCGCQSRPRRHHPRRG